MMSLLRLAASGLAVILLTGAAVYAGTPLKIHVSILPQKYFVERIAGQLAMVDVLVKPGKSPATYSPTPNQIRSLSAADVYFSIGVPFENGFMHKVESIAPNVKLVDCRQGVHMREMAAHVHDGEHHEEGHKHEGGHDDENGEGHGDHGKAAGKDPHIWMSPLLVKHQAGIILDSLKNLDPANAAAYNENYNGFVRELDTLHHTLSELLAPYKGETLFVFHPAFGYFADTYGMHQVAVETMGKAPKGKDLAAIIKRAKKENARVIFVQPQFDTNAAETIASAIKGHVISINPLAYDYLSNMQAMARVITRNLTP
ncbi:MAG: zinc ABC transporter substrate-binding protein [Desulfobacter sp.]|nr:MAG: zinc ABC transporter substrate-binding protein [Desulfobacter sp.]